MKRLINILIICITCLPQLLAQDTTHIDISDQLFYYTKEGKQVQYDKVGTQNNIHLKINIEEFGKNQIQILAPKNTSLLINNKIFDIINKGATLLNLNNTINSISLYNSQGLQNVQIFLLYPSNGSGENFNLSLKVDQIYKNFLIVASILILSLYLYNKLRSAELFNNHFKIARALTIKTINETLFKIRVLEKNNLILLLAHSLGIGLITITFINWAKIDSLIGSWFMFESFWDAFVLWLLLSLIVFIALLLKSAIIMSFTSIFNIKNFARIHFYTHLRITLIIYIIIYLIILINTYQFPDIEAFRFTLNMALVFMLIRIVLIFIKLMNLHSHRKVYLFSYLCATEILPYIFLVKITYV